MLSEERMNAMLDGMAARLHAVEAERDTLRDQRDEALRERQETAAWAAAIENDRDIKARLAEHYADDLTAAEARVETAEQRIKTLEEGWHEPATRDPIDVAEDAVEAALSGEEWECRDDYPYPLGLSRNWIERGVGEACERFLSAALPPEDSSKVERLLEVARAALTRSGGEQ